VAILSPERLGFGRSLGFLLARHGRRFDGVLLVADVQAAQLRPGSCHGFLKPGKALVVVPPVGGGCGRTVPMP
jgi:hypothetical protein